jgi:DNA-binding Lrp family transcriptional regulator
MTKDKSSERLLVLLQQGLPFDPRPFARLGELAGLTEADVLALVEELLADGRARRLGGIFDAAGLGYRSVLCAAAVPAAGIAETKAILAALPGVTHAYLRGWPDELPADHPARLSEPYPALWFTWSAPEETFAAGFDALRKQLSPWPVLPLPAGRKFKIQVVFGNPMAVPAAAEDIDAAPTGTVSPFSDRDRQVVRELQGTLAPSASFYAPVAARCGLDEAELLARLTLWRRSGALRRIALVLRHQRIGYKANAMCVWPAEGIVAEQAGAVLATFSDVTHCYQRPAFPGFPYSLYAMLHAKSWELLAHRFAELEQATGLDGGKMLCSITELKKTSMVFFGKEEA